MKAQTGFTALVASAAVVSAAPGAIRQGSVARTVEKRTSKPFTHQIN